MKSNKKNRMYLMQLLVIIGCIVVTKLVFANSSQKANKNDDSRASNKVLQKEERTLELLSMIDAFTEEDEKLREDAAKAHYNMGNIYYHKGEFEIAAREYYQAVTLMPNDPDSHYNLAYVSAEHLDDYVTSLKHYQIYLYLKPHADDVNFIKEQILHATLILKGKVDSPLENKY